MTERQKTTDEELRETGTPPRGEESHSPAGAGAQVLEMTPAVNLAELRAALEAIIYVADEPATVDQMARALKVDKAAIREALKDLTAFYSTDDRGIEIRKVAGGYRFNTKVQHHDALRRFVKSLQAPVRLTLPALETLAVIAYKQPVTVPEINEIRGVNSAGVIQTLIERKLITTAGRKAVLGRPILYRTSKEFLIRFGLSDVDELPSLKEFEALAQAALGEDSGLAVEENSPDAPEDAGREHAGEPSPEN
jgi:segregation and condensation protein B